MKITAVFCDAGSTNLLAYYLKNKKIKFDCYAFGAALKILPKIFPRKKIHKVIDNKIKNNNILITTTSLNNQFEFKAKLLCVNKKIKIISVLDHWINYSSRFLYKGKTYMPNEIWVFDNYAKLLSKKKFPNTKILEKENFYLKYVSKKIKKKSNNKNILYICEGNRKIRNLNKFENKNISKILNKFRIKFKNNYKLIIKLHPSSKNKKIYDKIMNNFKHIKYEILINTSIEKALSVSEIVIGIRSYAMYVSTKNNLKTYTLLENKNLKKYIPYKNVMRL